MSEKNMFFSLDFTVFSDRWSHVRTVVSSHLSGRAVSGDVHDHLLGQEQLVESDVDEGFPRPSVVRLLLVDPAYFTPVIERFLNDFGTDIDTGEPFLLFVIFFEQFSFGIRHILG